jgi:hypothetical protein
MNSRLVMTASAIFMALAGLAATFLPQEILASLGESRSSALPLAVQILGALYIAFAMLDWMAKESVMGGIYNRPIAMGNLLHFMVGALALAKAALAGQRNAIVLALAVVYAIFALAFASIVFGSPRAVRAD